jgi:hypothetical protein
MVARRRLLDELESRFAPGQGGAIFRYALSSAVTGANVGRNTTHIGTSYVGRTRQVCN